jgi:regulator of sigma E protease
MYWLVAILALGFLIVVHEFGHYVVARWCGMRVERFSVGFGPGILKRKSKKTGTIFQLAPIPFGGFVEIKGMMLAEDVDPDDREAYPNRPAWQRFVTIFAGPATNWISAIFLALVVYSCHGVDSFERYWVIAGTDPAFEAHGKLLEGDRLVAIDGVPIYYRSPGGQQQDPGPRIHDKGGAPVTVSVLRAGKPLDVVLQPKLGQVEIDGKKQDRWRIGLSKFGWETNTKEVGVGGAIVASLTYPVVQTQEIFAMFQKMVEKPSEIQVSSGIGIVQQFKSHFSAGWVPGVRLLMMMSVYLALFNLFPLPALDGGRLVFLTYELITRRRANPRLETTVHMVGVILLVLLMLIAVGSDIKGCFG